MNRLQRAAVLTQLAESLLEQGSWCGETHLQKATYLLQQASEVPMEVEYVFYKHGPYSFDLHNELTSLRADGLFQMVNQPYPYGPKLIPTKDAGALKAKFPKTLAKYENQIKSIATFVGSASAAMLERLSTALYVMREEGLDDNEAVDRITLLKPHVSQADAQTALKRIKEIL